MELELIFLILNYKLMTYFLVCFNIILLSIGQLLFKQAAIFSNSHSELSQLEKYLLNPWFYVAGASFVITTLVYMKILTNLQLSISYPITTTLAYALTIIGSVYIFNEKLSIINTLGIGIIFIGIVLASYSK